jgi:hypothetical protein
MKILNQLDKINGVCRRMRSSGRSIMWKVDSQFRLGDAQWLWIRLAANTAKVGQSKA